MPSERGTKSKEQLYMLRSTLLSIRLARKFYEVNLFIYKNITSLLTEGKVSCNSSTLGNTEKQTRLERVYSIMLYKEFTMALFAVY